MKKIRHDHTSNNMDDCPRCRLNIAAPDLLKACHWLLMCAQTKERPGKEIIEMAEKAIAKATGK